mgnify:CR=1 FL=1
MTSYGGFGCPHCDHPTGFSTLSAQTAHIKKEHPDAILEHYLKDVKKSVDIYIPSLKKIVECFGDYWHCNPKKYNESYYHKGVHKTAKEIWENDAKRLQYLKNNGYFIEVIWENSSKKI